MRLSPNTWSTGGSRTLLSAFVQKPGIANSGGRYELNFVGCSAVLFGAATNVRLEPNCVGGHFSTTHGSMWFQSLRHEVAPRFSFGLRFPRV